MNANIRMESPLDERYRLMLLDYYLDDIQLGLLTDGTTKYRFICPFCGPLGRTDGKKNHRKGALLWNRVQNSWVFTCAKKGSSSCISARTFGNFLGLLNPALGEAYTRERWTAGTAGFRHNCKAPRSPLAAGPLKDQTQGG